MFGQKQPQEDTAEDIAQFWAQEKQKQEYRKVEEQMRAERKERILKDANERLNIYFNKIEAREEAQTQKREKQDQGFRNMIAGIKTIKNARRQRTL